MQEHPFFKKVPNARCFHSAADGLLVFFRNRLVPRLIRHAAKTHEILYDKAWRCDMVLGQDAHHLGKFAVWNLIKILAAAGDAALLGRNEASQGL